MYHIIDGKIIRVRWSKSESVGLCSKIGTSSKLVCLGVSIDVYRDHMS